MKFTNPDGRIFKLNPIDFLCILFALCVLPMGYFGYKITTRPKIVIEEPEPTHYEITRGCPNCGKSKKKEIPLGELVPPEWWDKCDGCGNEGWFIKFEPRPKAIKPEDPNYKHIYEQIEYKQLLKEKGWLE